MLEMAVSILFQLSLGLLMDFASYKSWLLETDISDEISVLAVQAAIIKIT